MLKIQEIPGAMPLDPLRGIAPGSRVLPPLRVCPPANAPSGSGPEMARIYCNWRLRSIQFADVWIEFTLIYF